MRFWNKCKKRLFSLVHWKLTKRNEKCVAKIPSVEELNFNYISVRFITFSETSVSKLPLKSSAVHDSILNCVLVVGR